MTRCLRRRIDPPLVEDGREQRLPLGRRLLITADAGGSNGLPHACVEGRAGRADGGDQAEITCCHLPPGTSNWNKVERRLFSQVTMNWRGRLLTSHEVIVLIIAATTTRTGLRVRAELDTSAYAPVQGQ